MTRTITGATFDREMAALIGERNGPPYKSILERRQQRAEKIDTLRGMVAAAETANRELTAAEQRQAEHLTRQITEMTEKIDRQKVAEQREMQMGTTFPNQTEEFEGADTALRDLAMRRTGEPLTVDFDQRSNGSIARQAFTRDLLTTGTTPSRPTSFAAQILQHLTDSNSLLAAGARLITSQAGDTLALPRSSADSTAAIVAEGAQISESDPTVSMATLGAFKYAVLTQVSREMFEDQGWDIAGFIAEQAGRALGSSLGADLINGTGTTKPTGLLTSATLGVTAASASTVTRDELIDLADSVGPYGDSASAGWVMNRTTWSTIRKITIASGDARPLFDDDSPRARGSAGKLLGYPVYLNSAVPEIATGKKTILFGDFSRFYVRYIRGVRIERSDEFAFDYDLTTFRAILRADGALIDASAVKYLKMG